MTVFISLLMFVVTCYSLSSIVDKTKNVSVGGVDVSQSLTAAGCMAITLTTVAFDAACLFILVKVV